MAMKKKFLGLALATMVALPATSVYAAGDNNIINGVDTQTYTQNVKVSGSVSNKQGIAPAGKIEVELPTSMTFSVDEASNFKGVEYNVQNRIWFWLHPQSGEFPVVPQHCGLQTYLCHRHRKQA